MARTYDKPKPSGHRSEDDLKNKITGKTNEEEDLIVEALLAEEFAITRG